MKYLITIIKSFNVDSFNVTTTPDDVVFTSFPAEIGNPNYDQFLEQTKLTDKKVKALTPDEWYDFPEETVE
jgi:hypothetical protein